MADVLRIPDRVFGLVPALVPMAPLELTPRADPDADHVAWPAAPG